MEYNTGFFLAGGIIVSILLLASILYWTLLFRKNWASWKQFPDKARPIILVAVSEIALLYSLIRFFMMAARAAEPVLILFDFILILILTALGAWTAFMSERKKAKEKQRFGKVFFFLGALLVEALALILWLANFNLTVEFYMLAFYGAIVAAVLYLLVMRAKPANSTEAASPVELKHE